MSKIDNLIAQFCPTGVIFTELANVCQIKNGRDWKTQEPGEIPVYGSGGLMDVSVLNAAYERPTVLLPRKGSLNVQYVEEPFWNVDTVFYTVCDEELIGAKFLFYYLKTINLAAISTSSTRPSLTQAALSKIRVPVAPLPVQHEIVRILDQFTQLEAELEAELEARRQQYGHYRESLLNYSKDSQVLWSTLGGVSVRVSSGGTPTKSAQKYYENGQIPWLRTQEVTFSEIWGTSQFITEDAVVETSAKWIPEECLIVAISGASAGRSAINKIPLTTNQHCCNLQIDRTRMNVRFAFYWVSSKYDELKSLGRGARSDLNAAIIKGFPIPVPPMQEQNRVVELLDKFDSLVNDLNAGLPAEIAARRKQYEYYRDKLLTFKEMPA
ncbi:restriction endonuclease subunit S [Corynebacterium casei]|uniref:restriction endonuclease subunit S n=1 Tax=Corynebacterium casei TaxID=160386 RepID=UPI003FCFE731